MSRGALPSDHAEVCISRSGGLPARGVTLLRELRSPFRLDAGTSTTPAGISLCAKAVAAGNEDDGWPATGLRFRHDDESANSRSILTSGVPNDVVRGAWAHHGPQRARASLIGPLAGTSFASRRLA
jgi:hypothetical protein